MRPWFVFLLALVVTGCAARPPALDGTAIGNSPAPDFTLADQTGRAFRLADQHGRVVALFFGYTRCPDDCPTTMARLARALRSLPPAQQKQVEVVLVTVDPAHDDPRTLGRYVALFDPRFVGLTGSPRRLARVYADYHVWHQDLAKTARSAYAVAHGTAVYLIDPRGALRVLHDGDDPTPQIAHDLRALLS